MEENLLVLAKGSGEEQKVAWEGLGEEMKRMIDIAGPMVVVTASQRLLQVVSVMMVGHLNDDLFLSSAALAISLTAVTGFSFLMGMASGLETICGQAYGAQQHKKIGVQTYTAIFALTFVCLPFTFLWINMEKILTRLNNVGGALAMSISTWSNVIFLGLYMRYSPRCAKTRAPISMELFQGLREFFRFAIPSAVMICLEWWSFELIILLSGLLNTTSILYAIPFGIGAAASTRISNELGAGNPHGACVSVLAAISFAIIETTVVSGTLFACRHVFGYVFSNEKEVVDYVTVMAPLVCISVILDNIQGVLAGVARGCGWQHIGVYVNIGAFYLCGIPMAILLSFFAKMRGKGLWIGVQVGSFAQCVLLSTITSCINWEQQTIKARKRLFGSEFSADDRLI
ncbi:Protein DETOXIFICATION 12 [Glycine max]|nr:Protein DETOXIFICATION 12 [Glycine max]